MTPEEYKEFKEQMKENFRNTLGDAMQDMNDFAADQLEQRNMVVFENEDESDNDADYEKVDQWVGLLIWEIVTEWSDDHTDPFTVKMTKSA